MSTQIQIIQALSHSLASLAGEMAEVGSADSATAKNDQVKHLEGEIERLETANAYYSQEYSRLREAFDSEKESLSQEMLGLKKQVADEAAKVSAMTENHRDVQTKLQQVEKEKASAEEKSAAKIRDLEKVVGELTKKLTAASHTRKSDPADAEELKELSGRLDTSLKSVRLAVKGLMDPSGDYGLMPEDDPVKKLRAAEAVLSGEVEV